MLGSLLATIVLMLAPLVASGADIGDALRARGLNISGPVKGQAVDANALGTDCSVGDPVKFLMTRREDIPEYEIQKMTPPFACNLAKFIDAAEKAGHSIKIYSGARVFRQPSPSANCQRVPCVPSTHEFGCAADLLYDGDRQVEYQQCPGNKACVWAHQNKQSFGLQFRLMPENRFTQPEPWHIELAGAQGPANRSDVGKCPGATGLASPTGVPTGQGGGQTSPSNSAGSGGGSGSGSSMGSSGGAGSGSNGVASYLQGSGGAAPAATPLAQQSPVGGTSLISQSFSPETNAQQPTTSPQFMSFSSGDFLEAAIQPVTATTTALWQLPTRSLASSTVSLVASSTHASTSPDEVFISSDLRFSSTIHSVDESFASTTSTWGVHAVLESIRTILGRILGLLRGQAL